MIGFNEALRIAITRLPKLDYCTETMNAFIFKEFNGPVIGEGAPIVVLKDGGIVLTEMEFDAAEINAPVQREGFIG